ncbi:hypothetical protein OPQ81_001967 [Rhizoctonia solani]|nr:hypothetical protein OPQ81_001967 [Rhizoctonia solani]
MPSSIPAWSSVTSLIPQAPQPQRDFAAVFTELFSEYGLTGAPRVPTGDVPASTILGVSTRRKLRRWYTVFSRRKSSTGGTFHRLN